ncbi:hypothetical protein Pan44_39770 [Caulifigura coniformis]|uniref:Uncharacterized protein n=1 Tax=Caulifigura coniformis TaxID=2527983 RepID=A0A517SIJ8_9PLAN|nr:hypothetical protein [Caulifigura coniformis]QDT55929.1 hypothetical protein Pan44_39770 [Caulifigura coniformis]
MREVILETPNLTADEVSYPLRPVRPSPWSCARGLRSIPIEGLVEDRPDLPLDWVQTPLHIAEESLQL